MGKFLMGSMLAGMGFAGLTGLSSPSTPSVNVHALKFQQQTRVQQLSQQLDASSTELANFANRGSASE